jgi:hypothetical protein
MMSDREMAQARQQVSEARGQALRAREQVREQRATIGKVLRDISRKQKPQKRLGYIPRKTRQQLKDYITRGKVWAKDSKGQLDKYEKTVLVPFEKSVAEAEEQLKEQEAYEKALKHYNKGMAWAYLKWGSDKRVKSWLREFKKAGMRPTQTKLAQVRYEQYKKQVKHLGGGNFAEGLKKIRQAYKELDKIKTIKGKIYAPTRGFNIRAGPTGTYVVPAGYEQTGVRMHVPPKHKPVQQEQLTHFLSGPRL